MQEKDREVKERFKSWKINSGEKQTLSPRREEAAKGEENQTTEQGRAGNHHTISISLRAEGPARANFLVQVTSRNL